MKEDIQIIKKENSNKGKIYAAFTNHVVVEGIENDAFKLKLKKCNSLKELEELILDFGWFISKEVYTKIKDDFENKDLDTIKKEIKLKDEQHTQVNSEAMAYKSRTLKQLEGKNENHRLSGEVY